MKDIKYRTLVATLRKNILGGKYDVHKPFPSVRALIKRFGLSKTTVQHALDDLAHQGLVFREQGRGTFVTKMGVNRQIGLIVPGLAYSEFFHPILIELSRLCQEKEYGLLFGGGFSSEAKVREDQAIALARDLVKKSVCGVIMQPTEMSENAQTVNGQILRILDEANVPVVLLDSDIVPSPERSKYDVVGIDNGEAGRREVRHLVGQGARRISFASWPYSCTSIADRRVGARAEAHDHRGIAFKEVFLDPSDGEAVRRHVARFRPDAIICGYDTFAAYLKVQLEKIGKCVPDDIMLAGFDDLQDARITTPPLTTSHQPCVDIARAAFSLLLERVADRTLAPRKIVLHAPLVIRASTARRRKGDVKRSSSFGKHARKTKEKS